MAQLAILGHATRGEEVIEILEMLGGKNAYNFIGACNVSEFAYSINEQGIIDLSIHYPNSYYTIFTLEEFLEKYPYKIGDKVYNIIANKNQTITSLSWDSLENEVVYETDNHDSYLYVDYLQPYKEETMDRKYDVEEYLKVWKETEKGLEVVVNDRFELKEDNGKFYIIKKQPQYPKTYEECCDILDVEPYGRSAGYKSDLITTFRNLLICRDAYWKIAGEQMGSGKPWGPDWEKADEIKYCIANAEGNITNWVQKTTNKILAFPTEEICDTFYENFKELIKLCKELL